MEPAAARRSAQHRLTVATERPGQEYSYECGIPVDVAEVTEFLKDAPAPIAGGAALGAPTGYGLALVWPDPEPDPLEEKTVQQLKRERRTRWAGEGGGIGGLVAVGAVALEAVKVGIG